MVRSFPATLLLAVALLLGCAHAPGNSIVPIEKALENPRAFDGQSITLAGTVTSRQSLPALQYFSLRDNTGEIRVVTDHALPNVGARAEVHGRVRQAFALADQQLVVFLEDDPQPSPR